VAAFGFITAMRTERVKSKRRLGCRILIEHMYLGHPALELGRARESSSSPPDAPTAVHRTTSAAEAFHRIGLAHANGESRFDG
jgi:hypothetical protein